MATTLPETSSGTLAEPPATARLRGPAWSAQIALTLSTAILLDLCFPLAGPMRPWRGAIAWVALVPLLLAVLGERAATQRRYLSRSFVVGYLGGIAWYVINSYWIYRTMHIYAGVPAAGAAGILVLYSLVLGIYFGLFAWIIAVFRRRFGLIPALCLAPLAWPAVELLAYHLTRVPWDQLGYAQVDNFWLTRIAPWAGTYGIATVLVAGNTLFAAAFLVRNQTSTSANKNTLSSRPEPPSGAAEGPAVSGERSVPHTARAPFARSVAIKLLATAILFCGILQIGSWMRPAPQPTSATALLLQVNLGTTNMPRTQNNTWLADMTRFSAASHTACTPYYPGIYGLTHHEVIPNCANAPAHPTMIVWPEAPSPFVDEDPSFRADMGQLARSEDAGVIAGDIAQQYFLRNGKPASATYNSASVFAPNGQHIGRYDKIHLVPFGEYVPYRRLFFWASALVDQIGDFTHGWRRVVFREHGHIYGIFICYESIFSNEVRLFAKNGAQVFVNISDDAWYGDTSAPWQHLNMARMRAIENHRWLLLDTNNGLTCVIDPDGRITQSIPRHIFGSLAARYGFESGNTFYTEHGDFFAFACSALTLLALASAAFRRKSA
uniref:Apolipoprotein N-acyltransferase n=1 Tax=Acidobacterium capsulatum TaxID=33075 RepID=A0A7V4XS89_9BACT